MREETKETSPSKWQMTPNARIRLGQTICLAILLVSLLLMRLYIDQLPIAMLTGLCAIAGLVGDIVLAVRRSKMERAEKKAS